MLYVPKFCGQMGCNIHDEFGPGLKSQCASRLSSDVDGFRTVHLSVESQP